MSQPERRKNHEPSEREFQNRTGEKSDDYKGDKEKLNRKMDGNAGDKPVQKDTIYWEDAGKKKAVSVT